MAVGTAMGGALSACGSDVEPGSGGATAARGKAPKEVFSEPSAKLSGGLSILMWSHFVPAHDEWFDPFAQEWGKKVGVDVSVDHINIEDIPARISAEMQAGQGHDLIMYTAPLSQFEPSVLDMTDVTEEANNRHGKQLALCQKSSFNPTTEKYYAYSPSWVPDPGDYRISLWKKVGLPNGPSTWDELLEGGAEIKKKENLQLGIGMSQEVDSNMAASALMWSFGAAVQDENEQVVVGSDATLASVEYMTELYKKAMTQEVFSWDPASNNEGIISGQLSYILNSISGYRTAQTQNPEVADDIGFVPALEGPVTALAAEHVLYNWIVPKHAKNADAAKEFLLHYTDNFAAVSYHSQLYDFPAWPSIVPQLDGWLDSDPFGSKPKDKLALLKNAIDWSTNIGHPGPANTAAGEVFATYVLPNMFAKAARGDLTPQEAVTAAEKATNAIFDKWRKRGLVGG